MNYIGIDLAWTYRNETGICVINEQGRIVYCESQRFSDETIASIVQNYSGEGAVVAIDAPLIVRNETGSRYCDRAIMSEKIHGRNLSVFTCSRDYMIRTYGGIRGEEVVKRIQELLPDFTLTYDINAQPHSIIETFPTGIVLGLFPDAFPIKYKIKSKVDIGITKAEMARMIGTLTRLDDYNPPVTNVDDFFSEVTDLASMPKKELKSLEDKVDAFLCAYAAYWLSAKTGKIFGDDQNGFIVLPVEDQVQARPQQVNQYSSDLNQMVEAIRQFHIQNGLGTKSKSTMLYRMNLMMEELGEISQCLTKGKGNLAEEHADLLILLLGNCLIMNIDIAKAFWDKYQVIMNRTSKKIGEYNRVSNWDASQ
jgi:predicted RNase H-like nuclease